MKTAKEKAEQLVSVYFLLVQTIAQQKQCALIAVDELIKYAKTFGDVTELDIQHFEDIKKEIELL